MASKSRFSLLTATSTSNDTRSLASRSSLSTVLGIGTLSGKALKALGKAELRGIENFIIRRRLGVISLYFSTDDDSRIEDIDQMFEDLLELSRPDLYSIKFRQQALQLLLDQIRRGKDYGRRIAHCLAKWELPEAQLFVAEFMNLEDGGYRGVRRSTSIISSLREGTLHVSYDRPMITFICQLAVLNELTFQFLVDNGFLDMILSECIEERTAEKDDGAKVLQVYNDTLSACIHSIPGSAQIISDHPVFHLWPSWISFCMRSPLTLVSKPNLDRRIGWRKTRQSVVAHRLKEIIWALSMWSIPTPQLLDVSVDLLEFSRKSGYDSRTTAEARKCLKEFVKINREYWKAYRLCRDAIVTDRLREEDHGAGTGTQ